MATRRHRTLDLARRAARVVDAAALALALVVAVFVIALVAAHASTDPTATVITLQRVP